MMDIPSTLVALQTRCIPNWQEHLEYNIFLIKPEP